MDCDLHRRPALPTGPPQDTLLNISHLLNATKPTTAEDLQARLQANPSHLQTPLSISISRGLYILYAARQNITSLRTNRLSGWESLEAKYIFSTVVARLRFTEGMGGRTGKRKRNNGAVFWGVPGLPVPDEALNWGERFKKCC